MVNLQEADVPAFYFVTPATKIEDGDGFFGFATNF